VAEFERIARRYSLLEIDNIAKLAKFDRHGEAGKQVPFSEAFQMIK
jgi:hypothetical protein